MTCSRETVFFVTGIVFIVLGASGRPAFLGIGAAFMVIGSGLLVRRRGR